MKIAIFNGGGQVDYLYGLVSGLSLFKDDKLDVLDMDITMHNFSDFENVTFFPVYRYHRRNSSALAKSKNIARFYLLQLWYIISKKPRILHFQWLDRYILIDRIILPLIARMKGHKIVLTVHNINAAKRDGNDSMINRFSLRIIYRISDHLLVHTINSKDELIKEFGIKESKVSVVKHGMNNKVTQKGLTRYNSRDQLGINQSKKVILFFGNMDYYKGLDLLIDSLNYITNTIKNDVRLIIAGNSKSPEFTQQIVQKIEESQFHNKIDIRIGYIPDKEVEAYFMASDCIVLPYRNIYQSGVIFMAYTFGLPIIVTDIGNFKNDMIVGDTGFLIPDNTPEEIGKSISEYFKSELYENLEENRRKIKAWAEKTYSWTSIGAETRKIYSKLLNQDN